MFAEIAFDEGDWNCVLIRVVAAFVFVFLAGFCVGMGVFHGKQFVHLSTSIILQILHFLKFCRENHYKMVNHVY